MSLRKPAMRQEQHQKMFAEMQKAFIYLYLKSLREIKGLADPEVLEATDDGAFGALELWKRARSCSSGEKLRMRRWKKHEETSSMNESSTQTGVAFEVQRFIGSILSE